MVKSERSDRVAESGERQVIGLCAAACASARPSPGPRSVSIGPVALRRRFATGDSPARAARSTWVEEGSIGANGPHPGLTKPGKKQTWRQVIAPGEVDVADLRIGEAPTLGHRLAGGRREMLWRSRQRCGLERVSFGSDRAGTPKTSSRGSYVRWRKGDDYRLLDRRRHRASRLTRSHRRI